MQATARAVIRVLSGRQVGIGDLGHPVTPIVLELRMPAQGIVDIRPVAPQVITEVRRLIASIGQAGNQANVALICALGTGRIAECRTVIVWVGDLGHESRAAGIVGKVGHAGRNPLRRRRRGGGGQVAFGIVSIRRSVPQRVGGCKHFREAVVGVLPGA